MSEQERENVWITSQMGLRLRAGREAKGMTQSQLAQMVNASVTQIDQYEHGEHDMAMERLFDLARILEIPVAEIFDA
ncbi:MAG: helix-turn-helix transcriptional regulator [Bacillota bacterium]|nr:helix-turn-helix transcriptional regulator [Bacillota bacterium]